MGTDVCIIMWHHVLGLLRLAGQRQVRREHGGWLMGPVGG